MSLILKRKILWSIIGRTVGVLSLVLVNAYIARALSVEDFATYNFIMSIIPTLFTLLTFGQDNNSSRLLSINRNFSSHAINSLILFSSGVLIYSFLSFIIFNFTSHYFSFEKNLFWSIFFIIISSSVLRIISDIYRAYDKFHFFILFNSIRSSGGVFVWLFFSSLVVYFYWNDLLSINNIFYILAFSNLLALFFLILLRFNSIISSIGTINFSEFSSKSFIAFTKSSKLLFLSTFLVMIKSDFDFWIVSFFGNENDLAYYSPIIKIAVLVLVPLSIFESFLPRHIPKLYYHNSKSNLEKYVRSLNTLMFYSSLLVLIIIFLFSGQLLELLFGNNYSHLSIYLKFFILSFIPKILFGPCSQLLLLTDFGQINLKINLLFLIFSFIIGAFLTNIYGFLGMLITFSISVMLINLTFYLCVLKYLKIKTLPFINLNKINIG